MQSLIILEMILLINFAVRWWKILTEYDYEPGEPVDYVTPIIYYQSLSKKMTPLNFLGLFCSIIIVIVQIQVFV